MIAKIKDLKDKAVAKSATLAPLIAYGIIVTDMVSRNMIYAATGSGDAKQLMELIIKIICNLILILGALLALMGIIHFASAQSEGDGPAKQKAVMQIASGAMLALLSALLKSNVGEFSAFVQDSL